MRGSHAGQRTGARHVSIPPSGGPSWFHTAALLVLCAVMGAGASAQTCLLLNDGFESGHQDWTEQTDSLGTEAIITQDTTAASSGDWLSIFRGGADVGIDDGFLSQTVNAVWSGIDQTLIHPGIVVPTGGAGLSLRQSLPLPAAIPGASVHLDYNGPVAFSGANVVAFDLSVLSGGDAGDTLSLLIGGTAVFTVGGNGVVQLGPAGPVFGATYTTVTLPVVASGDQTVSFECAQNVGASVFYVDNVKVDGMPLGMPGGFEETPSVWTATPAVAQVIVAEHASEGTHAAKFGSSLSLGFHLKIFPLGTGSSSLQFLLNGAVQVEIFDNDLYYTGYRLVSIPLRRALAGTSPAVELRLQGSGAGVFYVDDFSLDTPVGSIAFPGGCDGLDCASSNWVESSANSIIVDTPEARSAPKAARFGGFPLTLECSLNVVRASGNGLDTMRVILGGDEIFSVDSNGSVSSAYLTGQSGGPYSLLVFDLTALGLAGSVDLEVRSHIEGDSIFRLDDFCLRGITDCLTGNAIVNGNFEGGPAPWTQIPAAPALIVPEPDGTLGKGNVASFGSDPVATFSFWLKIAGAGLATDSLTATLDNTTTLFRVQGDGTDSGGATVDYTQGYVQVQVTRPLVDFLGSHTLRFDASVHRSIGATVFLVDDIRLFFRDLNSGTESDFVLNGSFETGATPESNWNTSSAQVIVTEGGSNGAAHSATHMARFSAGVPTTEKSTLAQEVLHVPPFRALTFDLRIAQQNPDIGAGIANTDVLRVSVTSESTTTELQTILASDATYAKAAYTSVSIPLMSATSIWNDFGAHDTTVTFASDIANGAATSQFYLDNVCLKSAGGYANLSWNTCDVTPSAVNSNALRVVQHSAANQFSISANVTGLFGNVPIRLIVQPQLSSATDFSDVPAAFVVDTTSTGDLVTATFPLPALPFVAAPSGTVCTDGLATVHLLLLGPTDSAEVGFEGLAGGNQFILDTVQPAFRAAVSPLASGYISTTNDTIAAASGQAFPLGWPGVLILPASQVPLLGASTSEGAQVFFNTKSNPLGFGVHLEFQDVPPSDLSGNVYGTVIVGGFVPPVSNVAGVGADPSLPANFSTAMWDDITLSPVTSLSLNGGADLMSADWAVSNVPLQPVYVEASGKIFVSDLAGNTASTPNALHTWWMREAAAAFTGASQSVSSTPTFVWDLVRPGSAPTNAAPCAPVAQFRLWIADDQSSPSTSQYTALTDWSSWTSEKSIDRDKYPDLNTIINQYPDTHLMITVAGADEAGNVQDTSAAGDVIASPALCPVSYRLWKTSGSALALETTIRAQLWYNLLDTVPEPETNGVPHNTSVPGDLRGVRRCSLDELNFGSSTRVPLTPLEPCLQRVEAQFTVNPGANAPSIPGGWKVCWQLHEDNRLVAQGVKAYANLGNSLPEAVITIPSDLIDDPTLVVADFLNKSPRNCGCTGDRLGDDGAADANQSCDGQKHRRREVLYRFTARTVATDCQGTQPEDVTPATFSFSVYTTEAFKDEQPVKVFTRE